MFSRKLRLLAIPLLLFWGTISTLSVALPSHHVYAAETSDSESEDTATLGKDVKCEFSLNAAIGWFLCRFIDLIDGTLNWLDQQVNALLFVDNKYYSTENIGDTWRAMRNIALLLLVPMMLVMVIGTAVGIGPFDAYTVKKALPRMVLAVMFIVLSLPICQFAVQLSNGVGNGLGNLILSVTPPDARVESINQIFNGQDTTDNGTNNLLGLGLLVGGAAAGFGVGLTIFLFAATAVLGLFMGFVVLIMREVLLVTLIVIGPIAIIAWIFPGNDKLWSIWRTTFIAMLMMYPLIALLIAAGKFVAGISGTPT